MAIDSSSLRFFFFVMQSNKKKLKHDDYDFNDGDNYNYGGIGGRFAVLYSIDYNGEHQMINEMQVNMNKAGAIPVQLARYKGQTYLIREYLNSARGKVNELGMPDRNNKFQKLVTHQNWQITNIQVVYNVQVVKNLCVRGNPCGWATICVHMSDEQANCIDPTGRVYPMTQPATLKTTTLHTTVLPVRLLSINGNWWMYWLFGALFLIILIGLGFFCFYYIYLDDDDNVDQSIKVDEEDLGGGLKESDPRTISDRTSKNGVPQLIGTHDGIPIIPPLTQKEFKEKGIMTTILSWFGFGSDDGGGGDVEGQQQDITLTTTTPTGTPFGLRSNQIHGKLNKKWLKSGASLNLSQYQNVLGTLGAQASSSISSKTLKKRQQRTKNRQNLYKSLDKILDTESSKREKSLSEKSEKKKKKKNDNENEKRSKKTKLSRSKSKSKSKRSSSSINKKNNDNNNNRRKSLKSMKKLPKYNTDKSSSLSTTNNDNRHKLNKLSRSNSSKKKMKKEKEKNEQKHDDENHILFINHESSKVKNKNITMMEALKSMTSSLFTGSSLSSGTSSVGDGGKKYKWYDPLGCC